MKLNRALLSIVFLFITVCSFAQSSKELKRKKEALQREIELAQKNLNKTTSGKKLTLSQINAIRAQIRLRQEKISTINSEMKNLDQQIAENTGKVHHLQNRLTELKKEYAAMIRFAQRNRNAYDKMMFIFAAKDFNQAYKRVKYLQQFGQYRKKQAADIQETQKQLSRQIVVLDKDLKNKTGLLKEQETEKSKLDKSRSTQTAVLNKLNRQERQYRQDIQKKKNQQAAIDREIKAAIAREIAAARKKAEEEARLAAAKAGNKPAPSTPSSTSAALRATPEAAKLSDAFEANRGSLPSPVAVGYITAKFGTYMVGQASARHDGVVFQTSEGATARAVFNGTVSTVFEKFGRYFVIIKHGEYFTVYENLRSVSVKRGDDVSTKQTIGTVANSDGVPELGFQIHRGSVPQNPESWLAR